MEKSALTLHGNSPNELLCAQRPARPRNKTLSPSGQTTRARAQPTLLQASTLAAIDGLPSAGRVVRRLGWRCAGADRGERAIAGLDEKAEHLSGAADVRVRRLGLATERGDHLFAAVVRTNADRSERRTCHPCCYPRRKETPNRATVPPQPPRRAPHASRARCRVR